MMPIAYRGYRPTSRYIGLIWRGRAVAGIEIAFDVFGVIIWDMWMGWVKDE